MDTHMVPVNLAINQPSYFGGPTVVKFGQIYWVCTSPNTALENVGEWSIAHVRFVFLKTM